METGAELRHTREQRQAPDTRTLIRWSGLAAVLGGVLLLQAPLLHPADTPEGFASPMWVINHFGLYAGYLLVQLGLIGMLARQYHAAGRLGVLGFVVAFVGVGLTLMEGRDHTFSLPLLRLSGLQGSDPDSLHGLWELVFNAAAFSAGHILLGIATYRAGMFPRLAAMLLAVGAPILAFSPPIGIEAALIGSALYGGAVVWIGALLLSTRHINRQAPAQVTVTAAPLGTRSPGTALVTH
jgi:hypothetical protein